MEEEEFVVAAGLGLGLGLGAYGFEAGRREVPEELYGFEGFGGEGRGGEGGWGGGRTAADVALEGGTTFAALSAAFSLSAIFAFPSFSEGGRN